MMNYRLNAIWAKLTERCYKYVLAWQLRKILERIDAMLIVDARSGDEILGYDEHGLPH
jgi:hypothetical protein